MCGCISDRPLLGALNGRDSPRFTLCPAPELPAIDRPLSAPRFAGMPALGLLILPAAEPRTAVPFMPRPPAITGEMWLLWNDCCNREVSCVNDCGRAAFRELPKKRFDPVLWIVEGAAARPLADKLARVGMTGKLPCIMRAPRICADVAAIGRPFLAPK